MKPYGIYKDLRTHRLYILTPRVIIRVSNPDDNPVPHDMIKSIQRIVKIKIPLEFVICQT